MTELLPATARRLDVLVRDAQASSRTPTLVGAVGVDGTLAWSGVAGPADGAATDVAFRIGSITKTFTAVLVLRLAAEGRLRLDDRLDEHVGGTPYGDRTLRQLLSHQGGIVSEGGAPWWERSAGRDWERVTRDTTEAGAVLHGAGRRFHYSNLGFGALGRVVSLLRGRSWWECLQAELLEPLGMRRTTYLPEPPNAQGFAVHPYADLLVREPHTDTRDLAPAGQLWSTMSDLAIWSRVLIGASDVLPAAWASELGRWHVAAEPVEGSPAGATSSGYGLGVMVVHQPDGRRVLGHYGSMPGFLAGLVAEPATGRVGVSFGNSTAGSIVAADLLAAWNDSEPVPRPVWEPVDAQALPRGLLSCLGTWFWGPRPYTLVLRGTHGLELRAPEGGRASRFTRDGDGVWHGDDDYYAGEVLTLPADGTAPGATLDLGTFCFTRRPYDEAADVPGGGTDWTRP